jgi:hypothetical protein
MNILQLILVCLVSLSGFFIGLFLSEFAKDELKSGRKWFYVIEIISILGIIASIVFFTGEKLILLSAFFVFVFLMTLPSLIKNKNKK